MPNCIPTDSLLILGLSPFLMMSSFVMKIPFFTVLMWKYVSVLICILPSLLKICIHHVINFMMKKIAMDSIVPVVESTSAINKSAYVSMHVILMIKESSFERRGGLVSGISSRAYLSIFCFVYKVVCLS